ncbi:DUF1566 domain-containing protein [Myxococcota bacterium]|nr:DUF1566 domain-containing protein [Myxococcota bacterium]
MRRVFAVLLPGLVLASCLDPLEGKRFACDPAVPGTCADGKVCVPVESPQYKGLCMPLPGPDLDVPSGDHGKPDVAYTDLSSDLAKDASPGDSAPEILEDPGLPPDVPGDACVPDCRDRECGDDGCGGSCGTCAPEGPCRSADCIQGRCRFGVLPDWCFVDGSCRKDGDRNPANACQACRSAEDPGRWSALPKDTICQTYGTCNGEGVCVMPCWESVIAPAQPSCPDGFRAFDGCHCPVPPTGVSRCARNAERIPCDSIPPGPWYGQDGHFPDGRVRIEESGGTVPAWKDVATGILWSLKGASVTRYDAAALQCGGLGLPLEWGLPSRWVLLSVMDLSQPGCGTSTGTSGGLPLWPSQFGSDCTTANPVWTSTRPAGVIETPPLLVEMSSGTCRKSNWPEEKALGICARTPKGVSPGDRQRFVKLASSQATAFDRLTGLEWEVPPGDDVQEDWGKALARCTGRRDGNWRLPNLKELLSVMDESRVGTCPAWEAALSDSCRQGRFWWSGTPVPWEAAEAFAVGDDGVEIRPLAMSRTAGVICVRSW